MLATAQMLTPSPEIRGAREDVRDISGDIETADARTSILRKRAGGKTS